MNLGRKEISDKEQGLNVGADDYLTKPFDLSEASARVRALLRGPAQFKHNVFKLGPIELDQLACKVLIDGDEVTLLPGEYALLEFLMRHLQQVFSVDDLLENVLFPMDLTSYMVQPRRTISILNLRKIESSSSMQTMSA